MEENKKVVQGLPFELYIRSSGATGYGREEPEATAHKDKLKNVTPKEPVQLELPFEEAEVN